MSKSNPIAKTLLEVPKQVTNALGRKKKWVLVISIREFGSSTNSQRTEVKSSQQGKKKKRDNRRNSTNIISNATVAKNAKPAKPSKPAQSKPQRGNGNRGNSNRSGSESKIPTTNPQAAQANTAAEKAAAKEKRQLRRAQKMNKQTLLKALLEANHSFSASVPMPVPEMQ